MISNNAGFALSHIVKKMKNPNDEQTFMKIAIEQAKIAEENG